MSRLTRDELAAHTVRVLREGSGARPDVRLIEHENRLVVVKDYGGGSAMLRLLGLVLTDREEGAYRRLEGIPGVPRLMGRLDRFSIMIEYVEGESASTAPPALLTPELFSRLQALIEAMHGRGVVHGDLKRLDNIIISPDGQPHILDFSAAFWNGSNLLAALVFPYIWDDDLRAVPKVKMRRVPEALTPEDDRFLNHQPLVERWFRRVREYVRRPVQVLAGGEPDGASPRRNGV